MSSNPVKNLRPLKAVGDFFDPRKIKSKFLGLADDPKAQAPATGPELPDRGDAQQSALDNRLKTIKRKRGARGASAGVFGGSGDSTASSVLFGS